VAVVVWWGLQSDVVVMPGTVAVVAPVDEAKEQEDQANLLDLTMAGVDYTVKIAEAENDAQILVAEKGQIEQPPSLSILGTDDQSQ
jgi:hypothetical protein